MVVRVGILGASQIAPVAIIAPAVNRTDISIVAVAARDVERGKEFAEQYGIAEAYSNYSELISDPEIDLIYNGLPPSSHAELCIEAMAAGRHALCEKPFALNAQEARAMAAAADRANRLCIEGFHYFYHPLFARVQDIICSGILGPLTSLWGVFDIAVPDAPGNIRHELSLGGGALMDLGCYPLHMLRQIAGCEPEVIEARAKEGRVGIDLAMEARLSFDGVPGTISCDMSEGVDVRAALEVVGENGRLHVNNPLHPYLGHKLTLEVDGVKTEETVDGKTTFEHQLDVVVAAIAGEGAAHTGGADAIGNMVAIDAIYRASGLARPGL